VGLVVFLGTCGGDSDSITGPGAESCGPAPLFTALPVPADRIRAIPVVGGVDGPGHTLPTDHGAFFLDGFDIPVRAPADMTIIGLGVVRDVEGGVPGSEDYAIYFQVCQDLSGWFGHVVALAPSLDPSNIQFGNCRTYSTPFATVETCEARPVSIQVVAGQEIAFGSGVVDFGVVDQRVTNFYISPHRFNGPSHAVCMWEPFDAANKAILFSKLRDLRRPGIEPTGEPRCGTMEVDVPATAKGVWADPSITGPIQADETGYMALVDYPYRPQLELALSFGPDALGARLAVVGRSTTGRVNRAFEDVTQDGLIYCYGPTVEGFAPSSWVLQLTSATAIRIEHVEHAAGESPCADDPSTWSFGPAAVNMVR
jgi:hypothetical protein